MEIRLAHPSDARAIASLHAESWRRHYRGAYSDAFLDGDVGADRLALWTDRLGNCDPRSRTIVTEDKSGVIGFAHTIFEHDPAWGALLDNIHVAFPHQRAGVGSGLLARAADAVAGMNQRTGLYLWVLEQNLDAQAFYEARGARCVGSAQVTPPGGIPDRLVGSPLKLRYAWDEAGSLVF